MFDAVEGLTERRQCAIKYMQIVFSCYHIRIILAVFTSIITVIGIGNTIGLFAVDRGIVTTGWPTSVGAAALTATIICKKVWCHAGVDIGCNETNV